jgi:chromosome segregation ATPase
MAIYVLILSVAAVLMSLYCIIFMVPLKRFWERIDTIGGGLKGVEIYVDSIDEDLRRKLTAAGKTAAEQIEQARRENQQSVDEAVEQIAHAREELEAVHGELKALEGNLSHAQGGSDKVERGIEAMNKRLRQMRRDFDSQEARLRDAARKQIAESGKTIESTVLSALDALHDEMLTAGPATTSGTSSRGSGSTWHGRSGGGAPRGGGTIIRPLFGEPPAEDGSEPDTEESDPVSSE